MEFAEKLKFISSLKAIQLVVPIVGSVFHGIQCHGKGGITYTRVRLFPSWYKTFHLEIQSHCIYNSIDHPMNLSPNPIPQTNLPERSFLYKPLKLESLLALTS